jgi:hypothetical protein
VIDAPTWTSVPAGAGDRADAGDLLFFCILQDIAGLAVQYFANGLQGAEPDCFCFSGFENGKIGQGQVYFLRQFIEGHLSFGHHHVEVYNDRHWLRWLVRSRIEFPLLF